VKSCSFFLMAYAGEIQDYLNAVDFAEIASAALSKHTDDMAEMTRQQLLEGKLSTGKDISPTYLEDPYFKSKDAAQRYSDWKDKITPNQKRKKGVPNLIITGPFHNSIQVDIKGEDFVYQSSFKNSADILNKFSEDIFGLTEDSKEDIIEGGLFEDWRNGVEEKTGLKLK
jgi:hypothetical protein